jgi:lysophospholipase L1-like esterase
MNILALGDCNTLGINEYKYNSFPELLAKNLQSNVVNLGYTMATTREGINLYNTVKNNKYEIILISFGLTDSWKTFKHAPYVTYYPDNILKKYMRKIVKKYKKIAKKFNFHSIFGEVSVVPEDEYIQNISYIIENNSDSLILLLDTLPKEEEYRNISIKEYNKLLDTIIYDNVYRISLYDDFYNKKDLFIDKTHINNNGHKIIVDKIMEKLNECNFKI